MRILRRIGPPLAILLFAITLFAMPAHAVTVGTNVDLVPAPDRQQAEPTVAVDPQHPNVIVAGAQDYNFAGLRHHRWHAIYRSIDGGQTWTNNLLPGFPGDTSHQGANSPLKSYDLTSDPVMAFDNHGNLYYSGIALNVEVGLAADFVAKYANDGANYAGVALIVFSGFPDLPKIAVDRSGGPFDGNIYLTSFGGFSVSTDGGQTFSKPVVLPSLKSPDHSLICCTSTGITVDNSGLVRIVATGEHNDPKTGQMIPFIAVQTVNEAAKNLDEMVNTVIAADPITMIALFPGNRFRVSTLPEVASDTSGLYVVWSDNRTGEADVLLARSTDGGRTWSSPLRVNDLTQSQHFFPTIVTSGGIISVAWYDSRLTTNTNGTINALDVFYAESTNAGRTFSANVRVTSVSFNPNQARIIDFLRGGPFIGDYVSIAAGPGFVQPVWSDDRNACDFIDPNLGCVDEDIFTATITL